MLHEVVAALVDCGGGLLLTGFAGYDASHAVPLFVDRPRGARHHGASSSSTLAVACAGLGFPGDFAPRAVFLDFLLSGPDARHPCRYGPDGQLRGEIMADMVLMVQTASNCGNSVVAVFVVVFTPVVAQSLSHGPEYSSDLGFPSCFT